jgi:hypothetical protein
MMLALTQHCMTNRIRNSALLALLCAGLSCVAAAAPGTPTEPQNPAPASKHGAVVVLSEYACKKGTQHKGEREGLVSVVMQRGPDNQTARVFGVKDSKTGEMAFIHVLESDCAAEPATIAPGAASLVLMHRAAGQDEYYYAISGEGGCMRAFQIKGLGQFVPVDISSRTRDCQSEFRIWSAQAADWKAQASSAGNPKP